MAPEKQKTETTTAMYIWIDEHENRVRSKTVHLEKDSDNIGKLPLLNLNGDVNVFLKPVGLYNDPFSLARNKMVLCEVMKYDKKAKILLSKNRSMIADCVRRSDTDSPMFCLEQDFTLLNHKDWVFKAPFHTKLKYTDSAQGQQGQKLAHALLKACSHTGLNVTSCEATRVEATWSFKIGSLNALEAYDHLWIARYILERVAEQEGMTVALGEAPHMTPSQLKTNGVTVKFSTPKRLKNDPNCPVLSTLGAFLKSI